MKHCCTCIIHTLLHTFPVEVVFEYGHECGHLTEDQGAVIGGTKLGQHAIQYLKLARCTIQLRPGRKENVIYHTFVSRF